MSNINKYFNTRIEPVNPQLVIKYQCIVCRCNVRGVGQPWFPCCLVSQLLVLCLLLRQPSGQAPGCLGYSGCFTACIALWHRCPSSVFVSWLSALTWARKGGGGGIQELLVDRSNVLGKLGYHLLVIYDLLKTESSLALLVEPIWCHPLILLQCLVMVGCIRSTTLEHGL